MFRFRVFLVTGLIAVAGLAATATSASAQEGPNAPSNEDASCMGVLSSFVGADPLAEVLGVDKTRSDFAGQADLGPKPGQSVKEVAQLKSLEDSGDIIIPGLPPIGTAILSCSGQAGLP